MGVAKANASNAAQGWRGKKRQHAKGEMEGSCGSKMSEGSCGAKMGEGMCGGGAWRKTNGTNSIRDKRGS